MQNACLGSTALCRSGLILAVLQVVNSAVMAATGQVDSYCVRATSNGPVKVIPSMTSLGNTLVPSTEVTWQRRQKTDCALLHGGQIICC